MFPELAVGAHQIITAHLFFLSFPTLFQVEDWMGILFQRKFPVSNCGHIVASWCI